MEEMIAKTIENYFTSHRGADTDRCEYNSEYDTMAFSGVFGVQDLAIVIAEAIRAAGLSGSDTEEGK